MSTRSLLTTAVVLNVAFLSTTSHADDTGWLELLNGKDLSGWEANVHPESFSVENGVLKAHGKNGMSHLFYVGDTGSDVTFKDFELVAVVRSERDSNSGIFFHTSRELRSGKYLHKGYEVQLNSSKKEKQKTGSLYKVVQVKESPVDEKEWFTVRVRVEGKRIQVFIDEQRVVDYTEPENPKRERKRVKRLIDSNGGAIAIQAHDPDSVFYFKTIRIREISTELSKNEVSKKQPNVVFLFADDLGYGDLSCYGHPYARTPTLDKLASEGTRFTRFYVSGVTCCPSRTGFMTGLHAARFPQYPAGFGFGGRTTVTQLLKEKGYRIGHVGKWHIGPDVGRDYGVDEYGPEGSSKGDPRGRDAAIFDAAVEFIGKNRDRPFYLNVWGHITHYAVNAPDDQVDEFRHVTVDRDDFSETMQHKFDECERIGGNIDSGMREYLAEVNALDSHVKRVLDAIDSAGLRDNTIVVFSSDHGPAPVLSAGGKKGAKEYSANMLGYAGALRGGKHEQYEGGVRVPFIIRWPGHVRPGRVDSRSVLSGLDWLPTLCSVAGIDEVPDGLDGEDVSSAWFGSDRIRETPLFWRTSTSGAGPSVLEGNWKLHLGTKRKPKVELYDLSADPAESHNVADQHPEVTARLRRKADAWVSELPNEYQKIEKAELKELKRKAKKK